MFEVCKTEKLYEYSKRLGWNLLEASGIYSITTEGVTLAYKQADGFENIDKILQSNRPSDESLSSEDERKEREKEDNTFSNQNTGQYVQVDGATYSNLINLRRSKRPPELPLKFWY